MVLRVGPAGWSYPDWEGTVYPRPKPPGFHPLAYLSRFVDCVEVNSSFYGVPRASAVKRWAELVGDRPGFRFTAKLHRGFTHEKLPGEAELAWRADEFLAGLEPLRAAGRLSALLLQFPLGFVHDAAGEERLARLARLLAEVPLVLEVRHRTWFEDEGLAAIEDLGYSLASIDLPEGPDHPRDPIPAIGPFGYVRLHGRNRAAWFDRGAGRDQRYDWLYSPEELAEVVRTTRRLASGRDETFVITNNHFSGKAVANALELLFALEGSPPPAPPELLAAYPRLATSTRSAGQGTLF